MWKQDQRARDLPEFTWNSSDLESRFLTLPLSFLVKKRRLRWVSGGCRRV